MNASSDAIRDLIRTSNRAWREGRLDVLTDLLHPEVAFVGPRLEVLAEGRDACLRSYEEFVARAEIHSFVENAADIRITGSTAVATYEWSIIRPVDGVGASARAVERRLRLSIAPGDVTIGSRRTSIERGARGLDERGRTGRRHGRSHTPIPGRRTAGC